jgi:glycerophosphoryl diester phosphodiesterase
MFLTEKIISHRGIYDNQNIYENTLMAFMGAMMKGYIIELDVHLTKDGQLVVFHDYNLKRLIGMDRRIEEVLYRELKEQDIISIPLLKEVLEMVQGKVPLLIEIKESRRVGVLEEYLMGILKDYSGEYAIQSFSPKVLYWFKRHYPNVLRGQLSCSHLSKKDKSWVKRLFLKKMVFNVVTKPQFISYCYQELSLKKIKRYQRKGIMVLGWTVTNREDYDFYIQYFDNLICEKFI